MVTENPQEGLDSGVEELDLGGIDDSTSEDQLAVEAEITSEAPASQQSEAPLEDDSPPPAPETQQERVYTEAEWRKAQSSWQSQIDRFRNEALANQQAAQVLAAKTTVETQAQQASQQLQQALTAELGEAEAQRRVQAPEVQSAIRQRLSQQTATQLLAQQNAALQQNQQSQQVAAAHAQLTQGMAGWLKKLQSDYGLDKDAMRTVVNTIPDSSLENPNDYARAAVNAAVLAQRLRGSRVPRETGATSLESGLSSGNGAENSTQRANRIMNKMAGDWTDAEIAFMKGR